MNTKKVSILVVALILCSNILISQENKFTKTYDLNYSLEKGSQFTLFNNSYFVEYKKLGEDVKKFQQVRTEMNLSYKVLATSEEKLQFQVEYKHRLNECYYKQEIQKRDYSNFLGGIIKYTISSKGLVSGFEDFEQLNTELTAGITMSIDGLQEEIIHLLPALPDHPVCVGDKWSTSFGGEDGFESFSVEYTLLDEIIVDGIACVKIIANYSTENSYEVSMGGKPYDFVSKDKGHDIYYFAYKKGFLLSRYSIGDGIADIYDLDKVLKQQRLSNVLYETRITF